MEGSGTGAAPVVAELRANLARSYPVGKEKRPNGTGPNERRNDKNRLRNKHSYPVESNDFFSQVNIDCIMSGIKRHGGTLLVSPCPERSATLSRPPYPDFSKTAAALKLLFQNRRSLKETARNTPVATVFFFRRYYGGSFVYFGPS